MFPSNKIQNDSKPPAPPSAPPPPPPTPFPYPFDYPITTTGNIPLNVTSEINPAPPIPPPAAINLPSYSPGPWSTGLCDCCDNISSCCLTCWCPCVTFGRIAEIVDRGSTSCGVSGVLYTLILCVTGCSCLYSCFYRSKLRGQYFLDENPCTDCCVHCCCEECALCQEYRQLQNQGLDMSIGWHGNVERWRKGTKLVPPVQRGMNR